MEKSLGVNSAKLAVAERQIAQLKQELSMFQNHTDLFKQGTCSHSPAFREPAMFSGARKDVFDWLTDLRWKFDYQPEQFTSMEHKIAYAINHTTGPAREHLMEQYVNIVGDIMSLNDIDDFFKAVEEHYDVDGIMVEQLVRDSQKCRAESLAKGDSADCNTKKGDGLC